MSRFNARTVAREKIIHAAVEEGGWDSMTIVIAQVRSVVPVGDRSARSISSRPDRRVTPDEFDEWLRRGPNWNERQAGFVCSG